MKFLFTIPASIFIFLSFGRTQSFNDPTPSLILDKAKFEVVYNLSFQPDSLNPNNKREEKMILLLGQNVSVFSSYNKYKLDSIEIYRDAETTRKMKNNPFSVLPNPTRFNFKVYKNYPEGRITTTDYVLPDNYIYDESLESVKWQLSGETKVINGFSAQKAIANLGGRTWIAWFTNEIPISDGPYKFRGLPGLIICLHDTRNHYFFEMISISPETSKKIELLEIRFLKTTKRDFLKVQEAFRRDIISRANEAGLDRHTQQVAAENMRRRNNPIELTAD